MTDLLEQGMSPEEMLKHVMGELDVEITDTLDTQFKCDCSKEKVSKALASLSKKDLQDIINDGESIEVKCDFCNTAYKFEIPELKRLGNR